MRILVLSFYFQPDLCAGSFRCTALVDQLLKANKDNTINVVTTLPNRYASFSADALEYESKERLEINRIKLPSHKSGMLDQAKAFFHFYKQANRLIKNADFDVVVATSSRLMTAFLGRRIAQKKQLPLYLDIRDIFVDTLDNVLSKRLTLVLTPILKLIENYAFARADKVNLVSEGFLPYFKERYPNLKYDFYTNGIDKEFLEAQALLASETMVQPRQNKVKTILYAGNFGEGQGLHLIIPQLAKKLGDGFVFRVIGDGGRKTQLAEAIEIEQVNNVELLPPVNRQELIKHYSNCDVLFLHLNDYDAFKKVLPSKIFEYSTFNKPILAGVAGFAAKFIQENVDNAAVFQPCDVNGAVMAVEQLEYTGKSRPAFIEKYLRENIMNDMACSILETANKGK